ncbi:MAG: hypothetical protein ABW168_14945 [Sedimenticola sp.]
MDISSDVQVIGICVLGIVVGVPFMYHWIKDPKFIIYLLKNLCKVIYEFIPRIRKKRREKLVAQITDEILKRQSLKQTARFSSRHFGNRFGTMQNDNTYTQDLSKEKVNIQEKKNNS